MSECFAWKLKKCINQSITSLWRQRSFTSLVVLLNIDFKKSLDLSLSKIFPIISFALRFATRTASCSRWPESLEGSTSRMFFISLYSLGLIRAEISVSLKEIITVSNPLTFTPVMLARRQLQGDEKRSDKGGKTVKGSRIFHKEWQQKGWKSIWLPHGT